MSIGTLSQVWTQYQNGSTVQTPGSGTGSSQSYSDWMASLMSATGTTASSTSDSTSTGATLSDQMQALLVQLQGGGAAAAATGGGSTTANVASAGSTPVSGATGGHHHHHHGSASVDKDEDDVTTDVAAELDGDSTATDAFTSGTGSAAASGTASSAATDSSGSSFFANLEQAAGAGMSDLKEMLKTYGAAAIQGAASGAVIAAI